MSGVCVAPSHSHSSFSLFLSLSHLLSVCALSWRRAQIAQVQENNYILRVPINLAEFLVLAFSF